MMKCAELDAKLQKAFEEAGYKPGTSRLTEDQALAFLNSVWEKYPQMRSLYDPPQDMIDTAKEKGKDFFVNGLTNQAYPGELK